MSRNGTRTGRLSDFNHGVGAASGVAPGSGTDRYAAAFVTTLAGREPLMISGGGGDFSTRSS